MREARQPKEHDQNDRRKAKKCFNSGAISSFLKACRVLLSRLTDIPAGDAAPSVLAR